MRVSIITSTVLYTIQAVVTGQQIGPDSVKVKKLGTGDSYSCALLETGTVWCFGETPKHFNSIKDTYYLGNSFSSSASSDQETIIRFDEFPFSDVVTDMEASYGGVCATTVNKNFECFTPRSTYFEGKLNVAQPPLHVQQFDVDLSHTCLLLSNNRTKCFGINFAKQTGIEKFGVEATVNLPYTRYHRDDAVPKLIKTGHFSTCTLMTDGTVTCFGARLDFETRHALETRWPWEPAAQLRLGPNRTVASVEVGNYFVSLVTTDGKLMSIGHGPAMGLGNTTKYFYDYNSTMEEPRFVNVGTGRTVKQVAVFRDHSCVILDNDGLKCFGSNEFGQLGLGISDPEYGTTNEQMGDALPYVNLGDGRFAKQVSVAANHTCVLLDNDHVKCFGDNSAGQLGVGDRRSRGSRPEDMGNNLEYVYFVQPQDSSFLWVVIGASVGGICFLGIVIAVVLRSRRANDNKTATVRGSIDDVSVADNPLFVK